MQKLEILKEADETRNGKIVFKTYLSFNPTQLSNIEKMKKIVSYCLSAGIEIGTEVPNAYGANNFVCYQFAVSPELLPNYNFNTSLLKKQFDIFSFENEPDFKNVDTILEPLENMYMEFQAEAKFN